jgi:hypothetical protein
LKSIKIIPTADNPPSGLRIIKGAGFELTETPQGVPCNVRNFYEEEIAASLRFLAMTMEQGVEDDYRDCRVAFAPLK